MEEFPFLRCRVVALFALGNLDFAFALVSFSPWCFCVACGVRLIGFGMRALLVQQWIHVLQEAFDEFQYFLRCGELESWNVCSPFGLKCAQSMLLVAVFSARFVRGNLDIISVSAPFVAVCGGFLLLSATEPSMMKSSSSSRAEEFFITEGSG